METLCNSEAHIVDIVLIWFQGITEQPDTLWSSNTTGKMKVICLITWQANTDGDETYNPTFSLTSALDGGG
jgi:hypothetical protein